MSDFLLALDLLDAVGDRLSFIDRFHRLHGPFGGDSLPDELMKFRDEPSRLRFGGLPGPVIQRLKHFLGPTVRQFFRPDR